MIGHARSGPECVLCLSLVVQQGRETDCLLFMELYQRLCSNQVSCVYGSLSSTAASKSVCLSVSMLDYSVEEISLWVGCQGKKIYPKSNSHGGELPKIFPYCPVLPYGNYVI